jgi:hypothetical protein
MRRKLTFIFVSISVLIGAIYFIYPSYNGYSNTALGAVQKIRGEYYINRVIHQESVNSGIVLFYYHGDVENNPILGAEYVKHSIFGWKWVNGGMHGISKMDDYTTDFRLKYSFSEQYFPVRQSSVIGGFPSPMLMGQINNDKIQKIIIKDRVKGLTQVAKVLTIDSKNRIWFASISNEFSKEIDLSGLDEHGNLVVKKTADTNAFDQSNGKVETTKQ